MKERNRRHTLFTHDLALLVETLDEFEGQWLETGRFSVIRAASNLQRKHLDDGRHVAYADIYGALRRLMHSDIVHLDGARWVLGPASGRAAA